MGDGCGNVAVVAVDFSSIFYGVFPIKKNVCISKGFETLFYENLFKLRFQFNLILFISLFFKLLINFFQSFFQKRFLFFVKFFVKNLFNNFFGQNFKIKFSKIMRLHMLHLLGSRFERDTEIS